MRDFYILIIQIVMAYHGRYVMHASAVSDNGRGVLFLGNSGSGKTTLSMVLSKRGASFMGDDIVFLYKDGDAIKIGALLLPLKECVEGKNMKRFDDPKDSCGFELCTSSDLSRIFAVHRGGDAAESSFTRMTPTRSYLSLMRAGNSALMQSDVLEWQDFFVLISETVPFFSLQYEAKESVRMEELLNVQ